MRRMRAWLLRLGGVFTRKNAEREFADELESHLQMHTEDNVRRGMRPEEARRDALIHLGGLENSKQGVRDRTGLPMLENFLQDMRFGTRMLRKNPGFTAAAVLTLALGIGANSAIFSVVNAVLLRPLPYRNPERLVWIWATDERRGTVEDVATYPNFEDWRAQSRSFEAMAGVTLRGATLSTGEQAERIDAVQATPNLFDVLGVQPAFGRTFNSEELDAGTSRVVLLSDAFWRRRFGGRTDALGQPIRVNEETCNPDRPGPG
jgi:hypothetical protein